MLRFLGWLMRCHGYVGGVHFFLLVLIVDPLAILLHVSVYVMADKSCGCTHGDWCVESFAPSEAMSQAVELQQCNV